jgi:hypothetical protein
VSLTPSPFDWQPLEHVVFCGDPLTHLKRLPLLQVQYCCPLYAELAQFQLMPLPLQASSVPAEFTWHPLLQTCDELGA